VQAGSSVVEKSLHSFKRGGTKREYPRAAWGGAGAPLRFAPSPRLGKMDHARTFGQIAPSGISHWPHVFCTDHQPLIFLMTKDDLVSMLARWAITLQQYSFNVVHRPGEHHQNADLSRMPQETTEDSIGAMLHDE